MKAEMAKAQEKGVNFSHFGPEANVPRQARRLFRTYRQNLHGESATNLHSPMKPRAHGPLQPAWIPVSSPPGADLPRQPMCRSTKACTVAWWARANDVAAAGDSA